MKKKKFKPIFNEFKPIDPYYDRDIWNSHKEFKILYERYMPYSTFYSLQELHNKLNDEN